MAESQPLLFACLNVGHPQVTVVDEGKEGRVGRADLGVHPRPRTLGVDFQWLHRGHLGAERPGSGGQDAAHLPNPPQRGTSAYHEAILAPVPTVEEAVAGLEEEEAALTVEVIGGDAKDAQALPLPQQLLLARVDPVVGCGLGTHRRQMPVSAARGPGNWAPPGGTYLTWVHARENLAMSSAAPSGTGGGRVLFRSYMELLPSCPHLGFPVPLSHGTSKADKDWSLLHSKGTLLDCSSLVPKANPTDASTLFTPSSCQEHSI